MDLVTIRERLEKSWSIDTTYCLEEYKYKDPAWGQCVVTARLVQELAGGEIMYGIATKGDYETRHYWNRINGLDIDFTWRQFEVGTTLSNRQVSKKEDMLQNEWTEERFNSLKINYYNIPSLSGVIY